jgi:hypothetical protein
MSSSTILPKTSETALRRSSRIASKNTEQTASKNTDPVPFCPSKPTRMKDIAMELEEYEDLNDGSEQRKPSPSAFFSSNDSAKKLMAMMKADQQRFRYLLERSYLIDFFSQEMIEDLHEQIETFSVNHDAWTQELEKQMKNAIRYNKYWRIHPDDVVTNFPIMATIRRASETHNLFVSLYEEVTYIKRLIKNRHAFE